MIPKVFIHVSTLEKLMEQINRTRYTEDKYVYVYCVITGRILAYASDDAWCSDIIPGSWFFLAVRTRPKYEGSRYVGAVYISSGKNVHLLVSGNPAPGALFEVVIVDDDKDEDISALETFK